MENLGKIKGSAQSGSGPPDPCIRLADLDPTPLSPTSELMLCK